MNMKLHKLRIQLFNDLGPKGEPGTSGDDLLTAQYLTQIAELKERMDKMIPGEDYNKLLAEHKKLTDEFINKRPVPEAPKKPERKSLEELAQKLIKNNFKSNKEFLETSLQYRDAYKQATGLDVWGDKGAESEATIEVAEHIKKILSDHGDEAANFNFRLSESLIDDPGLTAAIKIKK